MRGKYLKSAPTIGRNARTTIARYATGSRQSSVGWYWEVSYRKPDEQKKVSPTLQTDVEGDAEQA